MSLDAITKPVPQLAQDMPFNKLADFVHNEDWAFEWKVDGFRLMLLVEDGKVTPLNRSGEPTVAPAPLTWVLENADAFSSFTGRWVFDGEHVDGEYWLFDLPVNPAYPDGMPFRVRRAVLEVVVEDVLSQITDKARLLDSAVTPEDKVALMRAVVDANGEGLVMKNRDSDYYFGKRVDTMRKAKLWKSVDCVVMSVGKGGKRSIDLGLWDRNDRIGSCKVTDKMLTTLQPGMVVEIKYLYVSDEPLLYQPSFLKIRDDKKPEECTFDQLKGKFVNKKVESILT